MSSTMNPLNRCPHLGLRNDPETWYAFPAGENHCHRPRPPQPVALAYQSDACLSEDHVNCPVFQAGGWRGQLPDGIRLGSKAPPRRVPDIKRMDGGAERESQYVEPTDRQAEPLPPDIEEEQVIETLPPDVEATEPEDERPPLDFGAAQVTETLPPDIEAAEPEDERPPLDFGAAQVAETLPPDIEATEPEDERPPLDFGAAQVTEPLVLDFEAIEQEAESPLPYAEAIEWEVEGPPLEAEPPEQERETTGVVSKIAALPRQVILLLVIVPVLIGLALVGLTLLAFFGALSPKAQPDATATASATPTTALLLDLPTPTPTATVKPAATQTTLPPTEEPTAKPTVVLESVAEATLAYDSNLRTGPGVEFDVISPLQAGTKLVILARDWPGLWLLVRTEDGREGWLAASQIAEKDIDIPLLPLAPDIATPPPPAVTDTPTE
jgi:hypothetical protein